MNTRVKKQTVNVSEVGQTKTILCPGCDGSGFCFNEITKIREVCPDCQGTGKLQATVVRRSD